MKSLLKNFAVYFSLVFVLPVYAWYCFSGLFLGRERVFPGFSQTFSLVPGLFGTYLRRAFYRLALAQCDRDACIMFGSIFSHPTCRIGRSVYIGPYSVIGDVTLEDDVLVSSHVSIINGCGQHGIERLDVPIREQPGTWPRVTIGRDSWIGERAVVQADVGRHCVIGSGAVVTEPIPDYGIAVGIPAKVIRFRSADERTAERNDELATSSSER